MLKWKIAAQLRTHAHTHTHTHTYIYIYIYINRTLSTEIEYRQEKNIYISSIMLIAWIRLVLYLSLFLSFSLSLSFSLPPVPIIHHLCQVINLRMCCPANSSVSMWNSSHQKSLTSPSLLFQQCPACLVRLSLRIIVKTSRHRQFTV